MDQNEPKTEDEEVEEGEDDENSCGVATQTDDVSIVSVKTFSHVCAQCPEQNAQDSHFPDSYDPDDGGDPKA